MFPLLALGLMGLLTGGSLAGGTAIGQRMADKREQEGGDKVTSLLGQGARDMGPPTEEGAMGRSPGFGLLQDPGNVENQARFIQGLLTLPKGQRAAASQMYGDMFSRLQQQGQFKDSQAQQAGQFDRQETRLGNQWGQQFGFQQDEARRAARQWGADFGLRQQEFSARALEQLQKLQDAGKPELPKLSPGWMYGPSASGTVAMPIPGTKDYADVTGVEQSLIGADSNIGRFLDVYAGKQQGAQGIRVGGTGNELSGEKAGELSTIRGKIIADVAVLQNKGVLQAGELEQIEKMLADPTKWLADFTSTKKGTTKSYETLRQQFKDKLVAHRNSNPWLLPAPPPGAVIDGAAPPRSPATPQRPSSGGGTGGAAPPMPAKREPSASIWDILLTGKKREYQ
jgi:hypothetical protein